MDVTPDSSTIGEGTFVKADVPTMRLAATQIQQASVTASTAFAAQNVGMEDALSGWSGDSKALMSTVLETWRSTAIQLAEGLVEHAGSIHAAAYRFETDDQASGRQLENLVYRPQTDAGGEGVLKL